MLWGLFFDVTRLVIGVTQLARGIRNLRSGDRVAEQDHITAAAALVIGVTRVLGCL